MNKRLRIERLEANQNTPLETTPALELYFKRLENHRREKAGEPPIALTAEEEQYERDGEPELRAYLEQINRQREEQ